MKRILAIIFFTILIFNSGMSEEINKTYSCAEEGWLTEKLKIYNSFDHPNGKFVTYSVTILGKKYLNFGEIYEGRIYGYNRSEQALQVDEISVEEGNNRSLSRYNFYSNEIKNLKSEYNSIIAKVVNFEAFNLSDAELENEVQSYFFTKNYIINLSENNKEKFKEMFIGSNEYNCEKLKNENQKDAESGLKYIIINQIENGCLQGAKNNNDLTPKVKKYCKCYANWFNENLNQSELNEFLNKSKIDKKKFIRSNNIAGSSSSICKI